MKSRNIWEEAQGFFVKEYGMRNMSLTLDHYFEGEGVARIEMQPSGLMKLMNDLIRLKKASLGLADDCISEPPKNEIKYTFDEVMNFEAREE